MDIFWIGAIDDQWDTVGNWSDTSGGLPNLVTPVNGDVAHFDGGSLLGTFTAPASGPAAPWSGGIDQNGHGVALNGIFANITITSCRFEDTIFDGAFSGSGPFDFLGATCSNESAAASGSFSFTDGATNNGVITTTGGVSFGNCVNAANVTTTGGVTVTGTLTNSATIDADDGIDVSGIVEGGSLVGAVTIETGGLVEDPTAITGNVVIEVGGESQADFITGDVTNAGNLGKGVVTGNVVCSNGSTISNPAETTITGNVTMNGNSTCNALVQGNGIFNNTSKNLGTVEGDATFNGTSKNAGTVEGNATFASGALNHDGATPGTVEGTVETPGIADGANWTHGLGGLIGDIQLTGIVASGGGSTNVFGLPV